MRPHFFVLVVLTLTPLTFALAEPPKPAAIDTAIGAIARAGTDRAEPATAQAAVEVLIAAGPRALPSILAAVPETNLVAANWLRSAFERIVSDAIRTRKHLPTDDLLTFATNAKKVGRARRMAMEAVEKVKPGTTARFLEGRLSDPEFSLDAVAQRSERAAGLETTDRATAVKLYREAFEAARDFAQCLALAKRLEALEVSVDPVRRLGVIRAWNVVGPFADPDEKGYSRVFEPEKGIESKASYEGKSGKVSWKPFTSEAPDGRVDLTRALAREEGAVAYAHAVLTSPRDQQVEIRAGGDDNLAVWVNGVKVIDHPTYRSHLRIDWHRAKVALKAGANDVLVKVCQCPAPREKAPGPPNKWEFHLRVVDLQGRGMTFPAPTK